MIKNNHKIKLILLYTFEKIYSNASLCGHLGKVDTSQSDTLSDLPSFLFVGNEPPESGHLRILDCWHFFPVPPAVDDLCKVDSRSSSLYFLHWDRILNVATH